LGRLRDGLLLAKVDLNLCRQIKDKWCLRMTQRLDQYAESFGRAAALDFKPDVIY
jgi:beta-ureidopropionase